MMPRETYYAALFTLLGSLKTAGLVKVVDRKVRLLEEMSGAELPALFMQVGDQRVARKDGHRQVTLGAEVILYVSNPDSKLSAAIALNGLIDAVDTALKPAPSYRFQTLGGIAEHAWIEGKIEVFDGTLGQRAAAIVPINILVP
jgi:hypothetical protein